MSSKIYALIECRRSIMKGKVIISVALMFTLALTGCGKKAADMGRTESASKNSSVSEFKVGNGVAKSEDKANNQTAAKQDSAVQEKKIIQNCSLQIVADDLKKLSSQLRSKCDELGGYIESEELMEERSTAKVRIPAVKFNEFIVFTENSYEVTNKNITTENITDAYVDNEARLKNLRAQEDQVLNILKKANTVEEVLKVQTELYKIRGEAEALEARKKSWDKQVDYATVTINVSKKNIVVDNKKSIIGGNDFLKASAKGFNNTLVSLTLFIQKFLIFVISNIIPIALLAVVGFFGFKKYRRTKGEEQVIESKEEIKKDKE
jgi:hypothetical protein